MEIQQDFREFIRLLNENEIEYLIIGGYAVAFHGAPRFTGYLDLWVNPAEKNAEKIIKSLDEFGFEGFRFYHIRKCNTARSPSC